MESDYGGARTALLFELLNLESPLPGILQRLKEFPWDRDPLVQMTAAHLEGVLRRYLTGSLGGFEIEAWANLIEVRDDIELEPASGALIRETVHALANPLLTEPLSQSFARDLLGRLAGGA